MKKADRLFQLVQLLQGRRTALTAQAIAQQMRVSVRTVYRDIEGLSASGVHIDGEPGVGYLLRKRSHVPPIMFSADEVLALLVGSRMVQATTDPSLAQAARDAELKIRAVLPDALQLRADAQPYRIPQLQRDAALRELHGVIRKACEDRLKVVLQYRDENAQPSMRTVWPLGLVGLNGIWMLVAWCELRESYRNFRFDRIEEIRPTNLAFVTAPTINLTHYFETVVGIVDGA